MAWILVLVIVVFIHELGHFLVARWCNVNVSVFSIGFGREIVGFTDNKGTRWKLGWIPLGGYVKFMDDENGASVPSRDKIATMTEAERSGSFHAKPIWQRAAVVAAGPMANFLSAILMFAGTAYFMGVMTIPAAIKVKPLNPAIIAGLKSGDVVTKVDGNPVSDFKALMAAIEKAPGRELTLDITRDGKATTVKMTPETQVIGSGRPDRGLAGLDPSKGSEAGGPARIDVRPDYAAVLAGLKTGDVVQRVDSEAISEFNQLSMAIAKSAGRELTFHVLRDGTPVTVKVTPQVQTVPDGFGGFDTRGIVGIEPGGDRSKIPVVFPSILGALWSGVEQTWQVITTTLGYFADVVMQRQSADKIGGIATVMDVSNKVATFGFWPTIQLIGLLSVSIGLLNLFPIPLLDGGHLMFYAYEAIRGRPLSERTQELSFRLGLAVVASLMILAQWNDRGRWYAKIMNLFS